MDDNSERYKTLNGLAEKILNCVELYKDKVPQGFSMLDRKKSTDIEGALIFLESLFQLEEKEIEKRQVHTLVTVDYENGVREFAASIIVLLFPKHDELKNYDVYRRLLAQKHVAYAFFHALNNNLFPSTAKYVYLEFHKDLYLGLVNFYEKFYGQFGDNEEAIELLCKYYPERLDVEQYKYKIAAALYMHISNAGTPSDRGYAFRGIAQIESYIGALPPAIIMELLGQYPVHLIANNVVFRHQVYAIIAYSQTSDIEKKICKFLLLDSVILALQLEPHLAQKITGEFLVGKFSSIFIEENYITDIIKVCEQPKAYWSMHASGERLFFLNEKPMVRILLKSMETIEIGSLNEKGKGKIIFPYSYTDWLLEDYFSKKVDQKLRKLIMGIESRYNQMFFSLLYLDNYRGMQNQIIDFDHKFQYVKMNKKLKRREENIYQIESFYGQAVQTLSCIVGKNGMGKTSIVDFLRESFFKILRLIEDYGMPCERGYIEEKNYQEYNILDKDARFLIVFQLGKSSFFLTNISDVEYEGVEPFREGIYNSVNEFSKVAYFSNMLKNNQGDIFFENSDMRINNRQIQEKEEIGRSLRGFRQVDYSETESFIRRRKAITLELEKEKILNEEKAGEKGEVNRELCYQLTFLKNMDVEILREYLDIDKDKKFKICSNINGLAEDAFSLENLKNSEMVDYLEKKYLFLPDAQIHFFSSGQYAKFAFLAKLYWFLTGHRGEIKRYRGIIGENEFRSEDVLLEGETALIFIDEGETYYHPEWQRRYVKTLLEMINYVEEGSKIQVVITTNSPFILSDILKEDVTYLTRENEKPFEHTLGQNIHRILKENFFMDYTIGEYARELIENIMLCLENSENKKFNEKREYIKKIILRYYGKEKEAYSAIQLLIEQIGEPVYRYELETLLNESDVMKEHKTMEQLLEEKRKIEEEIRELEKRG